MRAARHTRNDERSRTMERLVSKAGRRVEACFQFRAPLLARASMDLFSKLVVCTLLFDSSATAPASAQDAPRRKADSGCQLLK